MKAFIQDRERVLDSVNDLLKTSVYAENLVKVIENTPKDKVFTIGVFGGWGTGKSSIIRTAQDRIEEAHKKKVRFITYDAWKYANDSFRRMFLLKVQQELKMRQTEEMSRFYQSETAEAEPKTKLSVKGIALAVIVVAIISIFLFLIPEVDIEWKIAVPTIGTLGTFLLALLNGCFYDLKISYSKPALFAPEQFEECFKQMMSKCLKDTSWIKEKWEDLKDYVEVGEVSIKGLEKLVIVIDNIDRCPSDMAYQLLTDIKTFLSNEEYNLVFVVPVDDEALKKHLFRRWNKQTGEDINKEKEEFLRKFFNVTLRIKPHQVTELQHFAHKINSENNLGYTSDTLAIVAKEFSDNPRRIIQLLNNLSSELALYDNQFVSDNETAICAALILREEYPDFYKKATKDLDTIRKFSEEEAKEKDGKINEGLLAFMRVADTILKRTSIEALQKIFTNTSSLFSDLPDNIKQAVKSFDAAKVIEFASANDDKKSDVVDYALESLKSDVKYGATSQTTQWIDFLSRLYKNGIFDGSRFNDIDTALKAYYKAAVQDSNYSEELCYFASMMNDNGISSLRKEIIDYLNAENAAAHGNFENIFYAYLGNLTSDQDCKDIAKVVESYYNDKQIDKDIEYTDNQKKILFGDTFVTSQINGLNTTDDEARIENIVWCISNNNSLSSETFTTLFSKLIELFGNRRGKSKETFVEFVDNIQPILNIIRTSSLSEEPKDIYNFIVDVRGIPNPSWPHQSQRDTQCSILDEVDEEESKKIVAFCYEVMRISSGMVNISTAINKLYSKCKDSIIEGAIKIHSLNISIAPLATTLIQVDNYESQDDLYILEILFVGQDDINMFIEEDTIKSKIYSLVDNSGINGVEKLLGKLVKKEFILKIVTEYVAGLNSETINSLPTSIAKYAVSTFDKKNAETYKDNPNFLILVLKQGNAQQKKEVVRLMKDKINNETDLDNAILVLENLFTDNQQMLKTLIAELEGLKESETISDETKNRIENLITKLSSYINKAIKTNKFFKLKLK